MTQRHHPEYGKCARCPRRTDLIYSEDKDEYLCEQCLADIAADEAEAAWDRQQERDMESPPMSMDEQHQRAWEEHQKAHKR